MNEADLIKRFEKNGQTTVLAHLATLSGDERQTFLESCAAVDLDWLQDQLARYSNETVMEEIPAIPVPAPILALPANEKEQKREENARKIGEAALADGRMAAFLVAGGQGTRLGFDGPKGCYPLGPNTGKTLFQWHADQILARAKKFNTTIPWYIMTSAANHADTVAYFEDNDFLGFDSKDVRFFEQGMVPSIGFDGKLLLADATHLAMNPDGHGGSLTALLRSGALDDMEARGIDLISYFQVDNPLVTICDPVFAGYHLLAKADMSSKVVAKAGPEEKVGHVCIDGSTISVIEYSDMPPELMHATDEDGRLQFWGGSIAIHMINTAFVREMGATDTLPWHTAHKSVPYYDGSTMVTPEKPNAIKFETFVFDALPCAKNPITMEVARCEEFAPVKNKEGTDSVVTSRQALSQRFAGWLEQSDVSVPMDCDGGVTIPIEIAPTFALDADELAQKIDPELIIEDTLTLC